MPRRLRLHLLPAGHGDSECRAQLPRRLLPSSDPLHLLPFPSRVPSGLLRRREPLSKAVVMGADVAASACGTLPGSWGGRTRGSWGGRTSTHVWTPCSHRRRRTAAVSRITTEAAATGDTYLPTPSSRPSTMSSLAMMWV